MRTQVYIHLFLVRKPIPVGTARRVVRVEQHPKPLRGRMGLLNRRRVLCRISFPLKVPKRALLHVHQLVLQALARLLRTRQERRLPPPKTALLRVAEQTARGHRNGAQAADVHPAVHYLRFVKRKPTYVDCYVRAQHETREALGVEIRQNASDVIGL